MLLQKRERAKKLANEGANAEDKEKDTTQKGKGSSAKKVSSGKRCSDKSGHLKEGTSNKLQRYLSQIRITCN